METVIAAYDDRKTAEEAVERLVARGFSRQAVHLESSDVGMSSSASAGSADDGFFGSVKHFFGNLFDDDDDARTVHADRYAEIVRRGSTVVVVDAYGEEQVAQAKSLLHELDSVDVDQRASLWQRQGWSGFDPAARPYTADEVSQERRIVLPVVEEQLQVGKRTVETGGVRVVKRVVERPVSELVQLRREQAVVSRHAVDRAATDADFVNPTIEVRSTDEEAVVSKTARVVEEVVVGKQVTERTETVSDTVRRTDVDVERLGAETSTSRVASGASAMPATATAAGTTAATSGTAFGSGHATTTATTVDRTVGGDANRDPITGEPGAHPVGVGVGAALGGAAAGAATGTVAGPVGTVIGAAVGAVAGGLAGKGVAEKVDPTLPDGKR